MRPRTLRIRAGLGLWTVLHCLACGGRVEIVGKSEASTGPNTVGQGASSGGGGAASSSSSGSGSSSSGGAVSGSSGGTTSSSTSGSCSPATCAMGCCDSLGACDESGGDTECGFFGTACIDCTMSGATCVYGKCVSSNAVGPLACGGTQCDSTSQECCITAGVQACTQKGQCQGAIFTCVGAASCPSGNVCCLSQPAHGQPTAACSSACGANGSLYLCASNAGCPEGMSTCTFDGFGPGVGFCQ